MLAPPCVRDDRKNAHALHYQFKYRVQPHHVSPPTPTLPVACKHTGAPLVSVGGLLRLDAVVPPSTCPPLTRGRFPAATPDNAASSEPRFETLAAAASAVVKGDYEPSRRVRFGGVLKTPPSASACARGSWSPCS